MQFTRHLQNDPCAQGFDLRNIAAKLQAVTQTLFSKQQEGLAAHIGLTQPQGLALFKHAPWHAGHSIPAPFVILPTLRVVALGELRQTEVEMRGCKTRVQNNRAFIVGLSQSKGILKVVNKATVDQSLHVGWVELQRLIKTLKRRV